VRGLWQPDQRGAPRGHAGHQVLYRARLTAAREASRRHLGVSPAPVRFPLLEASRHPGIALRC
jgi:hypothetical protein